MKYLWILFLGTWGVLGQSGFLEKPANDDFGNRAGLSGESGLRTNAWTIGATRENGEPNHGSALEGKSAWWSWIAPSDGFLEFWVTALEKGSPILAAYTGGELSSLALVGEDANASSKPGAGIQFTVKKGVEYQFAVDGKSGSEFRYELHYRYWRAPSNDLFSLASALPPNSTNSGYTEASTLEVGDPDLTGVPLVTSTWWKWRVKTNGWVEIRLNLLTNGVAAVLGLYEGIDLSNLAPITVRSNLGSGSIVLSRSVQAGTDFAVLVGGTGLSGTPNFPYQLISRFRPRPANDPFEFAQLIASMLRRASNIISL